MQHHKYNYLLLGLLLAGVPGLPGCANTLSESRELIAQGKTDEGLQHLREGMAKDPGNVELKQAYYTQRERIVNEMLLSVQDDVNAGRYDEAEARLKKILALHPENPRATVALANLANTREHGKLLAEANQALDDGKPALAAGKARLVMAQTLSSRPAQDVLRRVQATRTKDEISPHLLDAKYQKTVTLEFRDAPIRSVFDMISRQAGINFVFDKDVRLDTKATLFARNTPINAAIDMLLTTGSLSKKVVNSNTLLIYPNQVQKQKDYKELMVKGFYLGNADAKSTLIMLKTLLKARDVYLDERLNMLIMRDTPEAIRLAEKVIALQDMAEPEVMLEVEILEVKRSKLTDLGVQYPNQFGLLNTIVTESAVASNGGSVATKNTTLSPLPLTLDKLRNIQNTQITVSPSPTINVRKDDSDVNILANPRIRVKNREKAKVHIGDKVPVITSNTTSTGVISESVSYLDVGLKLDVEPTVMQRQDVQIKVNLEVSNIVKEIRGNAGSLTYQIGTRNAGTTLRLKDGETQVLAGLISDEDRSAGSRIPGLGDLPLIGRLFSSQRDERSKTEIVLLITPHVLRTVEANQPALNEFQSGTDNAIGGSLPSFDEVSAAPVAETAVSAPAPAMPPIAIPPSMPPAAMPPSAPPADIPPSTPPAGIPPDMPPGVNVPPAIQEILRAQQAAQAQEAAEAQAAAEAQQQMDERPNAPEPEPSPMPDATPAAPMPDASPDLGVQPPPPFDPSGGN